MNKILVSSDHHANWKSLEYWFSYASNKKIPLVIAGDVVGDYNFEELAQIKGLQVPPVFLENSNTRLLRKLYDDILKFHAKKFADLIDKYTVETFFLHGNHEPIYFGELVLKYLEKKELFTDLNKSQGFIEVAGFNIAGISNTSQLMPFLELIYSSDELDKYFSHQRALRPTITGLSKELLQNTQNPLEDFDWVRLMSDNTEDLDIFFTHGQIGVGAWREGKRASELPTLVSAAKLSMIAKITVDGHLHSTHKMKNDLGKPTIRAVGNQAFIIEKQDDGSLSLEELESDTPYDARGGISLKDLDEVKSPIDKFLES